MHIVAGEEKIVKSQYAKFKKNKFYEQLLNFHYCFLYHYVEYLLYKNTSVLELVKIYLLLLMTIKI